MWVDTACHCAGLVYSNSTDTFLFTDGLAIPASNFTDIDIVATATDNLGTIETVEVDAPYLIRSAIAIFTFCCMQVGLPGLHSHINRALASLRCLTP